MKKLLFISHCVPFPPDKGERIRAFHEVKALSKEYEVTLVCIARTEKEAQYAKVMNEWCDRVIVSRIGNKRGLIRGGLHLLSGHSITEGYFHSSDLQEQVHELFNEKTFDLVFGYSSGIVEYVLDAASQIKVIDLVDMDSVKWDNYADNSSLLMSKLYHKESLGVAQLEKQAIKQSNAIICVSEPEINAAPTKKGIFHVVPNGVDAQYFSPEQSAADTPDSLIFVGSMDYRPNVEAVCWFCQQVWPVLKWRFPALEFHIVGRNPSREVRKLSRLRDVFVTGQVPDVRPYLSWSRIAIAPIQIARGIQNKVLEAMAMARPVVASSKALEGLQINSGCGILPADSLDEWTQNLCNLLADPKLCGKIGKAARRYVQENYKWEVCMENLLSLCRKLTQNQKTQSSSPASVSRRARTGKKFRKDSKVAAMASVTNTNSTEI